MKAQRYWRITGAVCIVCAAALAVVGARVDWQSANLLFIIGYWSIFLAALLSAIYCAIIDIRYISLEFTADQREAFRETLGNEEFRRALREAQENQDQDKSS